MQLEILTPKAALLAIRHFSALNSGTGWHCDDVGLAYAMSLANAAERWLARRSRWELVDLLEAFMVQRGKADVEAREVITELRSADYEKAREIYSQMVERWDHKGTWAVAYLASRVAVVEPDDEFRVGIAHAAYDITESLSGEGDYGPVDELISKLNEGPKARASKRKGRRYAA